MRASQSAGGQAKRIVLAERWRVWWREEDRRARDDLVLAYSPIVKFVAGRVAARMPEHVHEADLIADGFRGLMAAVEQYDPTAGMGFEAYAERRIRGAIFDGMRSLDWVPRRVRAEASEIERTTAELAMKLQRMPNDTELAAGLSMTRRQLNASLQRVSDARVVALDEPWGSSSDDGERPTLLEQLADPDAPDPAVAAVERDRREWIRRAIARLPGREQMILGLHYNQELTLGQIAEIIGMSESRTSQLHAKAVLQLRTLLAPARRGRRRGGRGGDSA